MQIILEQSEQENTKTFWIVEKVVTVHFSIRSGRQQPEMSYNSNMK